MKALIKSLFKFVFWLFRATLALSIVGFILLIIFTHDNNKGVWALYHAMGYQWDHFWRDHGRTVFYIFMGIGPAALILARLEDLLSSLSEVRITRK